ncbi:hypothetical protein [Nordella sp. HKS 07]|uniref:hypothetical protein n=1 Tax=Nordella sp. HKS 07 TaxID=2712222 RepID=UPI00352F0941
MRRSRELPGFDGYTGARELRAALLHRQRRSPARHRQQRPGQGPRPSNEEERATLAALYCALMVDRSLCAVKSKGDIIVDGPFAKNPVFLSSLAGLRPQQNVLASQLRDGTTQGAMVLALMGEDDKLPELALSLDRIAPEAPAMIADYAEKWRRLAEQAG